MSSDISEHADSLSEPVSHRFWSWLSRYAWPLLNIYGIGVSASGLTILVVLLYLQPPDIDIRVFLFMVILSTSVRQLGFPIGGLSNSLFGIVDLTTILLLGPLAGAWQAALSVLLQAALANLVNNRRTAWTIIKLPLFNASMKCYMALAAGSLYMWAGGPLRPTQLNASLIWPGLLLISSWFFIDYAGWSLLELFAGGRARFAQWTRDAVATALLVEFIPLPFAFLGAAAATTLGSSGLLMFALALILASLAVRLIAQARRRLEARVVELTTLNHVSEEIIGAIRNEQDICEIIYRYASQVVDTTYFLLGLIDDDGKTEQLAVLVAEGERQEGRTLPVGGVVTWMQEHRTPLVVSDLHQQALPFAARQVGAEGGLVRSALFVPLLAGQDLIGFMSIQSHLPNSFTADDTRILAAMANQAAMAIANIRLQRQSEIRARLERELRLASEIQRSLLPKSSPQLPGFAIASDWRSAREVSGDFYDFLSLPHGKLGIIIADVSDKGMPAALFMALSRSLVRSGLLGATSPAEGVRRANRWIIKDTSSDMFLTLFYAVLDPVDRTLTYVNAGHNPPMLFCRETGTCEYLDRHGIALGVKEDAEFSEYTVSMSTGDVLLCYTDGVTEAMNAEGELFGEQRLRDVASADCTLPPQEIITRINNAIAAYIGDEPPYDDATLIVTRCTEDGTAPAAPTILS